MKAYLHKLFGIILCTSVIISMFGALPSFAGATSNSTTLYAVADGYAWSGGTEVSSGADSTVEKLRTGFRTAAGNYRTLIKFDLSSIPAGAIITNANLKLYYYAYSSGSEGDPLDISVYRTTADWYEGGLSWSKAENYHSYSYDTVTIIAGTSAGYKTWDITSLVQSWVDGTYNNYGVLLRAPTQSGSSNFRCFRSREYGSNPPKLEVTYTIGQAPSPPEPISPGEPLGSSHTPISPDSITFRWNKNNVGATYLLYVRDITGYEDDVGTWAGSLVWEGGLNVGDRDYYTWTGAKEGRKYRWCVGAVKSGYDEAYDPNNRLVFVTESECTPPDTPTATSPGSSSGPGPVISTLTPTLRWNAASGADYYYVAISEYPYGTSNIVYYNRAVYGTSLPVPSGELEPVKKYRWDVRAHNECGQSGFSNDLYFQTEKARYTLTISVSGQGDTSPSPGTHPYNEGEQVTITATADPGWEFDHWGGDASGTSPSMTITMDSDKSVIAYFVLKEAKPVITSPLVITPEKDEYYVGDNITAEFTIKNEGTAPITFDVLTVGGRLNGGCPDASCPDFTHRFVSLQPDEPYQYEGSLTLSQAGEYHFFCAYHTEEHMLGEDENNWNTNIDVQIDGEIIEDFNEARGYRERDIIVEFPSGPYISQIIPSSGVAGETVTIKGVNFCELPPDPGEQWDVYFGSSGLQPDGQILSVDVESDPNEIVVRIPARDLRWQKDKRVDVYLAYGPVILTLETSNKVKFTYLEPVLEGIDPARTTPGRSVRLTGDYFGDGITGSPYFVKFGAETFDATSENVDWSNNRIDMEAPASLALGGTKVGRAINALLTLVSLGKNVGWGIAKTLVKEVVDWGIPPDLRQPLPVSDDDEAWLVWLRSIVAELPGFDVTLAGDLTVKVTVNTPVGESAPLSFTFTKEWVPINGDLYWTAPPPDMILQGQSPAEFRIYDSEGRVTGLVEGTLKEEIPNSLSMGKTVFIFNAADSYRYEVVGTDEGTYGLNIFLVGEEKVDTFRLTDAPISARGVHEYAIDWDALSQGEEGVSVQIDSDGDGTFEQTDTIQPPTASFSYSPVSPAVTEEITFDASESYDADGGIVSYEWNFGDGTTSSGKVVTHTYSTAGNYTVTLTVIDDDGALSTYSKVIQIAERERPPWVWIAIGLVAALAVALMVWYRMARRQAPKPTVDARTDSSNK